MENRVLNIIGRIKIYNVNTINNQNLVSFEFLGNMYKASYDTSDIPLKRLIANDILNMGVECFNLQN